MAITRRQVITSTALGGISAGISGIFFPKPAESTSINYRLSVDGLADRTFNNFARANIAQNASATLASGTDPTIVSVVSEIENEFILRLFTEDQTPFSQRLGNPRQPLWGRQKSERVGPNPGFATVQIVRDVPKAIAFSGSTTAGIDKSVLILRTDDKLTARELNDALIPTRERYEDWGTWEGDVNPITGELSLSSITTYETRIGSVTRRYRIEEPGPGGFGTVQFIIDGGRHLARRINIRVEFT